MTKILSLALKTVSNNHNMTKNKNTYWKGTEKRTKHFRAEMT